MKYTKEITEKIVTSYQAGMTAIQIAEILTNTYQEEVPERSVIAKLSSLGVYKKREYLTKRGDTPVKKSEYLERIALLLDVNAETLESLEKVNKSVLALLERNLQAAPAEVPDNLWAQGTGLTVD